MSGSLPPGITFDAPTATLVGTPTTPGAYKLTLSVTDSTQPTETVKQKVTLQIAPDAIVITPASLPGAQTGRNFRVTLSATGGSKPYQWSIVAGALDPGFSLNDNGVISGKATAPGTYHVTVRATDKFGYTGDAALELTVS